MSVKSVLTKRPPKAQKKPPPKRPPPPKRKPPQKPEPVKPTPPSLDPNDLLRLARTKQILGEHVPTLEVEAVYNARITTLHREMTNLVERIIKELNPKATRRAKAQAINKYLAIMTDGFHVAAAADTTDIIDTMDDDAG